MQKEGRLRSAGQSDKVGYPEKDTRPVNILGVQQSPLMTFTRRPHSKANRAGTRGFRAPEVLLKCGEQTGGMGTTTSVCIPHAHARLVAIDVWSAGMILLFFLTKKFPLFQSNDDTEALMEIATIIGRRRMEKTATLHSAYIK